MAGVLMPPLPAYLRSAAPRPFAYGQHAESLDCAQFAAGWIAEIAGVRLGPSYASEAEARALIRKAGGIRRLAQKIADDACLVEVEAPRAGDIGLVRHGGRLRFAICTGDAWALKTHRGVVIAPMKVVQCWRYGGGSSVNAVAIGALILGSALASTPIIGGITLGAIVGTIVLTAASIGLQYALAALNRPKPDPSNIQQTVRQAIAPRLRHYGTVRVGGTLAFMESKNGIYYRLIVTGSGKIDAVLENWLKDQEVTTTGSPNFTVVESPIGNKARIESRLGLDSETAYATLTAAFSGDWTSDHKLNGLSSALLTLTDPGQKTFGKVYEKGVPDLRQTLRAALVYDPRNEDHDPDDESTWEWSDNAVLCTLDYLTHPDGYGLAKADMDEVSWSSLASYADQLVALKGGGSEKRYRLAGSYSFAEPRKDVLKRMLQTFDGQIIQLANGKVGVVGGRFEEPVATLDGTIIIGRSWEFGADATERVNELKPTFVSPSHDYQETEAAAWRDEDAITAEGLVSQQYSLTMVPSHTQAQRLAKIAGRRINAPIKGQLKCNLGGLLAYQQRFIRVVDTDMGIDGTFIVDKFDLEISAESVGVSLSVTQVDESDWDWDAATEEGDAPLIPPNTEEPNAIEVPANVSAVVGIVQVEATVIGGQLEVSWDAPARGGLVPEVRYRRRISTGPDVWEPYQTFSVEPDETTFVSPLVQNDGSLYEVDVRFVSGGGIGQNPGDWSSVVSVTANADPVAPSPVTSLSLTGGAGQIAATWTAPNSANFIGARVYWNTVDSMSGATLFTTRYGAPLASQAATVTGLTAGTRWILVRAINGSGVESTVVSASATVT